MRMIDADALLTEIRKKEAEPNYQHTGEDWCAGLIIAEGLVDEQPTIEPQKWILCSERLPEDEQVVLVQDTEGTLWIWKYLGENLEYRGPYQWMDDNGVWQLVDEVVAWMPLPECYGGE